ncbi:hypothetical protein F4781DRAFT_49569 [Annulohypoxylon bovei var. microspora]|nr:hypothetical protein F4781DRAFT_49569 [Annulohypoxylon bovei var. microspora]
MGAIFSLFECLFGNAWSILTIILKTSFTPGISYSKGFLIWLHSKDDANQALGGITNSCIRISTFLGYSNSRGDEKGCQDHAPKMPAISDLKLLLRYGTLIILV